MDGSPLCDFGVGGRASQGAHGADDPTVSAAENGNPYDFPLIFSHMNGSRGAKMIGGVK